jgi:hypothetical protein
MDHLDHFLDEKQLAKLLGVSIRTLQNRRVAGGGIPFIKIGKAVRYNGSSTPLIRNLPLE